MTRLVKTRLERSQGGIQELSAVKHRLKAGSPEVRLAAAKILLHWVEGMTALFDRNPEMSLKELHAHLAVVEAEIAEGALGQHRVAPCQRQAAVTRRHLQNLEVSQCSSSP
jgi:hypothetical protein